MASVNQVMVARSLAALVGLVCLVPLLLMGNAAIRQPTEERLTILGIIIVGSFCWLLLWPRWAGWQRLKPGRHTLILFLCAYITPLALLNLAHVEHAEDYVLFLFPSALVVPLLWWATVGHRMDQR